MADLDHLHNGVVITDMTTLRKLIAAAVREALEERKSASLRLLTAEEAAERMGVGRETVLKWARRDGLPHRKLGGKEVRFVEAEIMEWGKVG
ncbi:MAG: helix-turn-helix domain-containing protein [Myxococcota bacterium]|nr:helix-turn-helix domain-containing protein [Myxococcota bacterium]